MNQCYTQSFTCIDCSRQFDISTVAQHTQCVTEHDKYAKGATKPGGFAAQGYYDGDGQATQTASPGEVVGEEYLSVRAPWICSICNVTCTSRETLLGHAGGAKHVRRAKARRAAAEGEKKSESICGTNGVEPQTNGVEPQTNGVEPQTNGVEPQTNGVVRNGAQEANETVAERGKRKQKGEKKKGSVTAGKKHKKGESLRRRVVEELKKHGGVMKRKKLLKSLAAYLEECKYTEEKAMNKLKKSDTFVFHDKTIELQNL